MNSYRVQAERRASWSRAPVSAARATVKQPLDLPPWGYGSGRPALSTTPLTSINGSRRLSRPRTRSVSPVKHTISCCETGLADPAVAGSRPNVGDADPSNRSNLITHGHEWAEFGVVVQPKSPESVAEKHVPSEINGSTAATTAVGTAVPMQHPYALQTAVDSVGDTVVTGGGPVTSSSMETWTTYDGTSTPPRVQSTVSSPHSVVTDNSNTPLSPPQSATSWLRRLSPTIFTTKGVMVDTDSANRKTDTTNALITPASPATDVTDTQKSIASTALLTANEPSTVVAEKMSPTPLCSTDRSLEQKTIASSANDSSASGEVTVNTPVSRKNNDDGKEVPLHRVASRTDSAKSPTTTPTKADDEDKSRLMVGLVKVKSRHTGLMIDCPILETVYQNEVLQSSATAVRQSSSHKVVLIKAVVPRWAWNGRGQFTPNSSARASLSSDRTTNRSSVDRKVKVNKRSSLVSVNTQTSDTLLPVRRTISEHQSTPPLPITVVDNTCNFIPALEDDCQLMPSPKLSACLAGYKSTPRTPTKCNPLSPLPKSRLPSSPKNTSCLSSARAQNKNLIPAETSNLQTSPLLHGYVSAMLEKPKESKSTERPSASMDYDSLMEDTIETLKLDLQFSSSGNNSDSESVTYEVTAATSSTADRLNRCSPSSSEELGCDRQPSSSYQAQPTPNWSCAATAATASSDAIVYFKTAGYVDEMAVRTKTSPSSPHQKPASAGRSARTPPSQCRSPIAIVDNRQPFADDASRHLSNNKYKSSPNSSQKNDAKTRLAHDNCSRRNKSPCMWRSATSNNVKVGSDLSCEDPRQYELQQRRYSAPTQQQISSTTQYVSRSESSLSGRSKSTFHDCYEAMTTKASPTLSSTSSRSPRAEQSSTLPPGQLVTSGASDTCTTEPIDVNKRHHHRATDNFRSNTTGDVESTTHQSRHHHRSTHVKKSRGTERKSPAEEHYEMSASGAKRSGDRRRKWSAEAMRCSDVAQSSQSTGSMAVSRNDRSPAANTRRQQPSSASRHMPRNARVDKQSPVRDMSAVRRASSSRGQHCSTGDNKRRSHMHRENHSASNPPRRSGRQTTSSGRRQQHGSRATSASVSRSADTMSRRRGCAPSVHTNYTNSVADESKSSKPKRAGNRQSRHRDDHSSPATFYGCQQPVIYCSPRSLKPFPPPISDRYPLSFDNSDAAVVGTSLDAEPVQYVFVQCHDNSDYGADQAGARNDYQPLNVPLPPRPQHPHRPAAAVDGGGGRRRKKLPATPIVDGKGWCTAPESSLRIAVPKVIERPAWKQY